MCEVCFPDRRGGLKSNQLLLIDDSAGFAAGGLPISVLLDLALPAGTAGQPDPVHDGLQLFLFHGQRFLPGYVAYPSGCSSGLVLFLSDHLLAGFCAGAIPDVISPEPTALSTKWIPAGHLLRSTPVIAVHGCIADLRGGRTDARL